MCVYKHQRILSHRPIVSGRMASSPQPTNLPAGPQSTRLFCNGNSQAVRIPRAFAFESDKIQVEFERRGEDLIIRRAKRRLTGLGAAFRELGPFFEDFRRERPPMETPDWESTDRKR